METLSTEVPTLQGDVMIVTKDRSFLLFSRPRTSVMPIGLSHFGMKLGFQARYRTSEPKILEDLHLFFVQAVAGGDFETLLRNAKVGLIEFPPEYEHLRQLHYWIQGLNCFTVLQPNKRLQLTARLHSYQIVFFLSA